MYKLSPTLMMRQRVCFPERVSNMFGHLFQNYDTIYVRFFATYTCVLSCFVGTNAHIYAHKKAHIYALQTSMWLYAVTESRRVESTELYRQPKTPSCTVEMKGNFGLNQSWLQWSRSFRARFGFYSLPSQ